MPPVQRTTCIVVASLMVAGTINAQTAKKVAPPAGEAVTQAAQAPAAALDAKTGKAGSTRATATFSDGTSAALVLYDVKTARERGSGLATGKRQHSPAVFRKEYDKASPVLAKAMASKQPIKLLTIINAQGITIELFDVVVESVSKVPGKEPSLEEVMISFARATVNGAAPKTMAMDDWMAQKR